MAVAVRGRPRPSQTSLKMNLVFLVTSVLVMIVMGISMWVDTHPEWIRYADRFAVLERKILLSQRAELLRKLQHPDYVGDYLVAKKRYLVEQAAFDQASGELEAVDADLGEAELRVQSKGSASGEGGTEPKTVSGAATNAAPASKSELDELDKEFAQDKSSSGNGAVGGQPPKLAPAPNDKTAGQGERKGGSTPGGAQQANSKEMDELDKEFKDSKAPKGSQAPAATQPETETTYPNAKAPEDLSLTFEEANIQVNVDEADSSVEAARRNLLVSERLHSREMIGLPSEATAERNLADLQLKEAQQSLVSALAGVKVESAKGDVKAAAQMARWARDVVELNKTEADGRTPEENQRLQESKRKLDEYVATVRRDLRLVEGRLERNRNGGREVQQIYCERLGTTDRCTTCHLAIDNPAFQNAPEPFRSHPVKMLQWHPVERFGCVTCHGGWGTPLSRSEAHGELVGKGRPLLYGETVQASCGKCHGDSRQLVGESTYLEGSQLFQASGCIGCHKVEALGLPTTKRGPALDRVAEKLRPEWLAPWVKDPKSHSLDARMPNLGLSDEQAREVATYLLTQQGLTSANQRPITMPTPSPERLAAGQRLVKTLGCMGCHTILGQGATVGPELTNLRRKVRPDWLYAWLQNPKAYLPNGRMPVFGLTSDECVLIGDYLLSLGSDMPARRGLPLDFRDTVAAEAGAKLVADKGCAGCHDIRGFYKMAAPDLTHVGDKTPDLLEFGNAKGVKRTTYDWMLAKIKDPKTFDTDKFKARMPKFGLDSAAVNAIAVYLLSLTSQELPLEYKQGMADENSPLVAGARLVAQHDCTACHTFSGQGGKIGPELTREGERVQPIWLFKFLKRPFRIRWWQDARMPDFRLSDAEATKLSEYLMALSNQPEPYEYTPPEQLVYPLAVAGVKYFADLKCQSCHPVGGKQMVVGGDVKKLGPDLGLVPARLKRDWMFRFLKDPQAVSPGTQMPSFNKPDYMYQALIDYLMKGQSP
jgi:mono/diheme cytochrome c family protein